MNKNEDKNLYLKDEIASKVISRNIEYVKEIISVTTDISKKYLDTLKIMDIRIGQSKDIKDRTVDSIYETENEYYNKKRNYISYFIYSQQMKKKN